MPNPREKLIELQHILRESLQWGYDDITDTEYLKCKETAEKMIANGVTVQQWIPVTERLPEKDGHYLCNYHFGEYPKRTFTQVLDYYATDIVPHFQHTLGDGSMKVTHWMEIPQLPEPPKGDREND